MCLNCTACKLKLNSRLPKGHKFRMSLARDTTQTALKKGPAVQTQVSAHRQLPRPSGPAPGLALPRQSGHDDHSKGL